MRLSRCAPGDPGAAMPSQNCLAHRRLDLPGTPDGPHAFFPPGGRSVGYGRADVPVSASVPRWPGP
jgi:hypothetical protein